MSDAADFASSAPGFYRASAVDQVIMLAWFAEARRLKPSFDGAYLRQCFKEVGVDSPDMSVYLPRLAAKKPPQLVKERGAYRLSAAVRRSLDVRLGGSPIAIAVAKTLTDLPNQLPDLAEREFLTEALKCYRVQAYRAAIVMAWNLVYDHLVRWTLADTSRLSALNAGIASKYPKKGLTIVRLEDFDDLKESEFIESARVGNIIDKNTAQILKEKLGRRNMAAHPSRVSISQHSADEMITDLINNVVLRTT